MRDDHPGPEPNSPPPDNRPTTAERDACRPWPAREPALLRPNLRVVVVLGGFGRRAALPVLAAGGWPLPRPWFSRPTARRGTTLPVR